MVLAVFNVLAELLSTSPESFVLIFSLFITYPLAWVYLHLLGNSSRNTKYSYFVICGIIISLLNYGVNVCHSVFAILFTYISLKVIPPSKWNVIINFVFHMAYLLIGYKINESDDYDVTWTMPYCVLTLRLIGLSFDLWDGTKDTDKLSSSFKKSAVAEQPTLLELSSYVFFPASYIVGPQFSLNKFRSYIDQKFSDPWKLQAMEQGLKRLVFGILYLVLYQGGSALIINENYFLTKNFDALSLIRKHLALAVLNKIFLAKYIACWLISEGACISFGLAYNGVDSKNQPLWDGCKNVNLEVLEKVSKFNHYVESFNINTNAWMAQYIYKRMAFLGNRYISRAVTLFFIATWHGLRSGYFMAFILQFFVIIMEKDIETMLMNNETFLTLSKNKVFNTMTYLANKLYTTIFLGFAMIPFGLMTYEKWWQVYKSLYFTGLLIPIPYMILYRPIFAYFLKTKKGQLKQS